MFPAGNVSGGALGISSNPVFAPPRGTPFINARSAKNRDSSVFHGHLNSASDTSPLFGGSMRAAPMPVLGGTAPMNAPQHGMLPNQSSMAPFPAATVFGTGMPPPSYAGGVPHVVTSATATIPSPAAPLFVTPVFGSPLLPPPPPASSGGGILSDSGSVTRIPANVSTTPLPMGPKNTDGGKKGNNAKDGASSRPAVPKPRSLSQRSQEPRPWPATTPTALPVSVLPPPFSAGGDSARGGRRPSSIFSETANTGGRTTESTARAGASGTAAPVLPFSQPLGIRDTGGPILGSAFGSLATAGDTGKSAGMPQLPPPPGASAFGASAKAPSTTVATASFPLANPMNAATKSSVLDSSATAGATEPASLIPVAAPPTSVFGTSVFGSAPAAATGSVKPIKAVVSPPPPPPSGIARALATDANTPESAFGQPKNSFGAASSSAPAPVFSAFGAASPAAPGGGGKLPTNPHETPFSFSQISENVVSAPAAVTSAFGAGAASRGGSSVFSAAVAASATTSAGGPASSFGASVSSGKSFASTLGAPKEGNTSGGSDGAAISGEQHQRRRGRSPTASNAAEGGLSTPRTDTAPPRRTPRQQATSRLQRQPPTTAVSRIDKIIIPPLSADEKKFCIAARLCKSLLIQLASAAALGGPGSVASSSREEDVAKTLEQAFFGVVGIEGVYGDFGKTAGEMLALWNAQVKPMVSGRAARDSDSGAFTFPGELWIALFALGTYLNTILSTLQSAWAGKNLVSTTTSAHMENLASYKAGLRAHPTEALTDACHYANELSELLQALFQRTSEADAPPYSVIPVVLRRVRSVFDEATARGVATVQSNLNAVTSKLFAVLNRRVKMSAVQPLGAPGETPRWLLTYDSKVKESLLHSFAYLVGEMIAADAPTNDDVDLFISAFHECFPSALAERCMLYYRRACALLRQPLSMPRMEEVAMLLTKATVVYPPDAPSHNKRVLLVKLLAAELALGRMPPDNDWLALDVPQLVDVVNALKTSRLDLLDVALKMHGPFFVGVGIHNALCLARQRLALLMVVKFYLTHGCESRLCVSEMVRYHRLPYSAVDAGVVWLLPLLVEKQINGVLDHDFLILSSKTPFDDYPREVLAEAAAST